MKSEYGPWGRGQDYTTVVFSVCHHQQENAPGLKRKPAVAFRDKRTQCLQLSNVSSIPMTAAKIMCKYRQIQQMWTQASDCEAPETYHVLFALLLQLFHRLAMVQNKKFKGKKKIKQATTQPTPPPSYNIPPPRIALASI